MAKKKEPAKAKRFPPGLITAFALGLAILVVRVIWTEVSIRINPDTRDAKTMAKDVLCYRSRLTPDQGCPSDDLTAYVAEQATCQMQLMGFWEGPKPEKPEPPKKQGEGVMAEIKFRRAQQHYPQTLRLFPLREQLWEENNKNRGEFVFAPGKVPSAYATEEEVRKTATKYLYWRNIFGYVAQARYHMAADMLYQLQSNEYWRGELGWLHDGFEEHLKGLEAPAGSDKDKWLREVAFREYVYEVFLSKPLKCPRKADGSCMKDWDGTSSSEDESKARDCLLIGPLADMVTRANRRMHEAKKGEIQPMVCYRNNLHQAVLWVSIASEGCSMEGGRPGITLPGTSMHGLGMAMDVKNYTEAQVYLASEAGMLCGFIDDDDAHCSLGEVQLSRTVVMKKRLYDAMADGRDVKEFIKEHGGEIWDAAKEKVKQKFFR